SCKSATSATTLSLPAGGRGLNTLICCEPCSSMPKLNVPILPIAPKAGQAITAYVGSTCCSMSWLFSVVNARSSRPQPTPSAYSIVSRSVHSTRCGFVVTPIALGSNGIYHLLFARALIGSSVPSGEFHHAADNRHQRLLPNAIRQAERRVEVE